VCGDDGKPEKPCCGGLDVKKFGGIIILFDIIMASRRDNAINIHYISGW
jgi:hypothetical protein